MTWQKVRIRILEHPRLEVGKEYEAERDENGWYYIRGLPVGENIEGSATVFPDEAEEVKDAIPAQ